MINGKYFLMLAIFASVLSEDPFGGVEYYLLEEDAGDDQEIAQENEEEEGYDPERIQDNQVDGEGNLQEDHQVDAEEDLQKNRHEKDRGNSQKKKKPIKVESDGCSFHKKMQVNKSDIAKTKAQIFMEDSADIKILSCTLNGNEIDYSFNGALLTVEGCFETGENILDLFVFDGAGNICRMGTWRFCL